MSFYTSKVLTAKECLERWGLPGPPTRQTTLVTGAHGLRAGDRLSLPGDSNRVRRIGVNTPDEKRLEFQIHIRPSRGFARHVRTTKRQRKHRCQRKHP